MDRETERRIGQLIQLGVVCDVAHEDGLCRVSFGTRVSPWSPWVMGRAGKDKDYWHPDIGEQALYFSPYGDGSEGIVMFGIMSNRMPLPDGAAKDRHITEYGDGSRVLVDRAEHVIEISDSYGSAIRMHSGYIDLLPAKKVRIKKGGR